MPTVAEQQARTARNGRNDRAEVDRETTNNNNRTNKYMRTQANNNTKDDDIESDIDTKREKRNTSYNKNITQPARSNHDRINDTSKNKNNNQDNNHANNHDNNRANSNATHNDRRQCSKEAESESANNSISCDSTSSDNNDNNDTKQDNKKQPSKTNTMQQPRQNALTTPTRQQTSQRNTIHTNAQTCTQETSINGQKSPTTTGNMNSAKEWKALFDTLQHRRPQTTTTDNNTVAYSTVQTTILQQTDNWPVGDTMTNIEDTNTCRINFQNIKGLNTGKGTGKWDEIISTANKRGVSILGLAETNTEWNNNRLTSRLKGRLRKQSNHLNMTTSTSAIKVQSYYKPGGTATIALNNWAGRVIEPIQDKSGQGRWSGFKIRAHRPIIVITAYRVPQTSIDNVGYKTAYAQQWAVARMAGDQAPEPREKTIRDLTKAIQQWQQTQDIILLIEANEQIEQRHSGISKLITECSLTDIIATRHQQASNTATYTRGTRRIDIILVSATIAQAVTSCGLLAFFDGIHSRPQGIIHRP